MLLRSLIFSSMALVFVACGGEAQEAADRFIESGDRVAAALCVCPLDDSTTAECVADISVALDRDCVVDAMAQNDDPSFSADCNDAVVTTFESCMQALPCGDVLAFATGLSVCSQAYIVGSDSCYQSFPDCAL